ncbi:ABC-type branched-chain amino acid transporter [Candidatus Rhodobacter oscarellae]|uniref:ABC-type branched-chain amino acid transporter n=1 Tax=Candidatus Rhodobacter oscarellae TaxID=1675527 RepID=A0A0J9E6I9_9RHOB|nr:penicillin-binding protein activator [Candidatus Rhodobacter lobularis]KMW58292.1 ABC-type branched-chain amino acid transporter [Candidatus Rhodobacter lobularis]
MTGLIMKTRRRLVGAGLLLGALALAACDVTLPAVGTGGPRINTSKPVPVALLIPRGSGQSGDEILAASLESAARLAMTDLSGVEIDLRVYATAGSPAQAASVADQAVSEGAKIILGPVYGAAANAAGTAVAARNVNVLAFSNNTDIAGGNVYVLGNTFENTANRLVNFAAANGKGNILIVNGQDAAEEKGRAAIASAIARSGATQAGTTSFELSQNGVVQAVPLITSAAQSSGANAIFYTSGTAGALPILSQLVTENGIDKTTTQFIGLQRWDIPVGALELGPLQGGWFAVPDPALTDQFRSRYQAVHGEPPHPIAGLAYDGIAAIGALVQAGKADALTGAALTQPTGFSGVNGVFRLRADGTNERGLAVATIRENKVVVIDPAPRSFGGAGL